MSERTFIPPDVEKADAVFRHTAPYTEAIWHRTYNLDERLAGNLPLPPIISTTKDEWEQLERPKILQQFKDILYGKMPPAPDFLETVLLTQKNDALDDTAIRKEIRITSRMKNGKYLDFDMLLYVPKNAKIPPPVFVMLNFSGNQAATPEQDVLQSRGYRYTRDAQGNGNFVRNSRRSTEKAMNALNVVEAIRRGYAVATADYSEICPDYPTGIKIGPMALFYDDKDLRLNYEIPFSVTKET